MEGRKTKIFYLITKGSFGGASRYVLELATGLPKGQFDVSVIIGAGDFLREKLESSGIRVIQLNNLGRDISFKDDWSVFWKLWKILRAEKPDIIHLNSSKIGGLGALAGRLAGIKKIIFTGHGWAFNEKRSWLSRKLILLAHWTTVILCHTTIAVSEKTRQDIEQLPLVKNRLVTIYNGLPPIKFFDRAVSRSNLLPGKSDKFWIGTISELHKNKGLDILIEAFAKVVKEMLGSSLGWSLILVIISDGEEKANLQKLINEKRLDDRIFLLGQIPDARAYLKAFDIFTLTSRTEAFPYTILEAGLAGIPIIASEVGGIPEVITDPEFGILVPPENIKELDKSLLYMIKRDKYRKIVSANLKKRIQENFSIKKMVEKTIELYKK